MARAYERIDTMRHLADKRASVFAVLSTLFLGVLLISVSSLSSGFTPGAFFVFGGILPSVFLFVAAVYGGHHYWIETERKKEQERRSGKPVLGLPPKRDAFSIALKDASRRRKGMIDRYLVGFEVDSGEPIWVTDDEICGHGCVFAKTGVGKTLWLEALIFQQMARGRASGCTFIDAKRDPGTLADIILMALITGRIEDVVVVDPFDPVCAYNFVFTTQRADVKARKVLRCGLPPTTDQSTTKHYDRLAADAVYRVVRAMESLGLAWSVRDVAVALSAFQVAYPRMQQLLHDKSEKQAMVELGHLASSYRTAKGGLDSARLTDNLRGIASELHSISNSEAGEMFCAPRADLSLTDSILRGKIIYYMLPRLEEAESAARMVKVFREDLEVSIGEITSNRDYHLEDPHLVIIDEGASTFGPTWANLFELARKGRFALLFGAQSVGGLMDAQMGLSEQFYERVLANINLKVIMRVGDNRTAMDMCEWIGKISTRKQSFSTATGSGVNARGELTKNVEINRRASEQVRDAITISEDEEDLVSAEELKHEMSAEKGLAWFDKGDGRLRKGRAIWFNADIPATWEGREFLTRFEAVEADEIGLAEWVDEHILAVERAETERRLGSPQADLGGGGSSPAPAVSGNSSRIAVDASAPQAAGTENQSDDGGPFRLNLLNKMHSRPRARTYVGTAEDNTAETQSTARVQAPGDNGNKPTAPESPQAAPPAPVVPNKASQPSQESPAAAASSPVDSQAVPGNPQPNSKPKLQLRGGPKPSASKQSSAPPEQPPQSEKANKNKSSRGPANGKEKLVLHGTNRDTVAEVKGHSN